MVELSPFLFDNFIEGGEPPVLDLALNRRHKENDETGAVLSEIKTALKLLLADQGRENRRFVKMFLAEISPILAEKYGDEIIKDYIMRHFPETKDDKKLEIYLHPANIESVRRLLGNMYEERMIFFEDGGVPQGGCRIVWEKREEKFSTTQILDKIREQLNGVIGDD